MEKYDKSTLRILLELNKRPDGCRAIQLSETLNLAKYEISKKLSLLAEEDMYALVVDVDEGCDTGTPAAWAGVNARLALKDPATREAFLEALGRSGLSQAE